MDEIGLKKLVQSFSELVFKARSIYLLAFDMVFLGSWRHTARLAFLSLNGNMLVLSFQLGKESKIYLNGLTDIVSIGRFFGVHTSL
ncbi:hypothetical protein C7293_28290 [filamentous cyanobacterium CCT1]|nr:hypothetical protein C7293_28290 [filamentous cyanobacterium CCT1]PSN76701.1 hypothetical protein C8B47_25930 [filamentous cyanobacterium CCP4]